MEQPAGIASLPAEAREIVEKPRPFPFLTARWSNLAILTYAVPPEVLQPHLPPGLELDTGDGSAFVSLVAFDFLDTRVLGVPWPGYRNFPEINLRYYVRAGGDRGVVFLREIVSRRLVAWLARRLYNEPYAVAPLSSRVREGPGQLTLEHCFKWGGQTQRITVTGNKPAFLPAETSTEHFFKEHRWGFGVTRRGRTLRYEVRHPAWQVYPVHDYQVEVDWAQVYGPEWAVLAGTKPYSTVFAVGSPVAVYPHGKLVLP
jgi:uncharacterized protein YqjF (DUF2071 family)